MAKKCPKKLTPHMVEDICEMASRGYTANLICKTVGICTSSLRAWLADGQRDDAHPAIQEFSLRYDLAKHAGQREMLDSLLEHGKKDWRATAWVLERTLDEFKVKARMSQAARERLDEIVIEKCEAELEYVRAKTLALKDGVVSEEDVVEELERIQRENALN